MQIKIEVENMLTKNTFNNASKPACSYGFIELVRLTIGIEFQNEMVKQEAGLRCAA